MTTTTLNVGEEIITIEAMPTTGRTLREMTEEQANARRAALAMKALESAPIPADASVRAPAAKKTTKEKTMPTKKKTASASPALATPVISPAKPVISPSSIAVTIDGQPRELTAAERDMVAAVLTGKITARTPKTTASAPRSTRPVVCVIVGVDKALGATGYDGSHGFPGWTASYLYCTDLVRKLKAAGIKTSGNYSSGVWTAVHEGNVVTVTNERPASAISADAA